MSDIAVRVEGLGKRYRIGAAAARHDSVRQAIAHAAKAPLRNLRRLRGLGAAAGGAEHDSIWALRGVSFEIRHGEVLGVIGRNGAGKSTLLKILSRITDPTRGRVEIHGRVGALLEVGTGFHQELTGRDNIYLNGSILGMDRAYIDRKFDEIVEFSGVEKFIDTPVKRYSSGMYLRLAFSVAAHLEPDILVVDEVLAVGDAEFQKRCVGKMGEVARHGRTVVFVSHNLGAVRNLCSSTLLLAAGEKIIEGPVNLVLARYASLGGIAADGQRSWDECEAPGDARARLRRVEIQQPPGAVSPDVDMQEPFDVVVEYDANAVIPELNVAIFVSDSSGAVVLHTTSNLAAEHTGRISPGRYRSVCSIPANLLNMGTYVVHVAADEPFIRMVWYVENAAGFSVTSTCPRMGRYAPGSYKGPVSPRAVEWSSRASLDASTERRDRTAKAV